MNARKLRDYFKRNPNHSIWDVAKKVNSSIRKVQQATMRASLYVFKVKKAPNRTDKQNTVAKSRSMQLYREWFVQPKCIVIYDETYIEANAKQITGLEFFVGKSCLDVPLKFR